MTDMNDTQIEIYNQILRVDKHMTALRDIYENIPEGSDYFAVFSIVGEGLQRELNVLSSMALKG